MKKYILIAVTLFLTSFAYSQSDNEEIDLMQAAFGMDKKAVVAAFVMPSPAKKDAFWKLYDQYEAERKELGKQRIELLKQYAGNYLTMTGVEAEAWTKQVMQLQKKTDKLTADYYSKVLKATDGVVATQFYQIENYILMAIRANVLSQIPFLPNKN